MNVNQLSKRLECVAGFLPKGANFADIGSDHAYLPCYVCLNDPLAKSIAGEVNQGPYESALKEVKSHQLEDRIAVRLGNGLDVLKAGEVSEIVIAGMGGPLIRSILEKGKLKLSSVERIVVQPNVDARALRIWFFQNGYQLKNEAIIEENGHIYELLVAEKGDPVIPYTEENLTKELWLGPYLLANREDAFQKKWKQEQKKKEFVLEQMKQASAIEKGKVKKIHQEITWLKEVLDS